MVKHRVYSKYAQETAFLIGQQIKLARKTRKWSSANLAERAGITRETLQRIENGDMKTPNREMDFGTKCLWMIPPSASIIYPYADN